MRSFLGDRHRAGTGELEEGNAPSGITCFEKRWRSPKVQVTTVPGDLGIRRRENNARCLILFFFLQCRRKEVGSSFVQNRLLPCVQQVLRYRSATQLHPFARPRWPHQARWCCTAPHPQVTAPFGWGRRVGGTPFPAGGTPLPASTTLGSLKKGHHQSPPGSVEKPCPPRFADISFKRYCPSLIPAVGWNVVWDLGCEVQVQSWLQVFFCCAHVCTEPLLLGPRREQAKGPTAGVPVPGRVGSALPGCPCCQRPSQGVGDICWGGFCANVQPGRSLS